MTRKVISPRQFENYLKELEDLWIVDFHYVVDTFLYFGYMRRFQFGVSTLMGRKKPDYKSERELFIQGNWEYWRGGKMVESTEVKGGEDGRAFRKRMGRFEDSIRPQFITKVDISPDGKYASLTLENGGVFKVTDLVTEFENYKQIHFLKYSHYVLSASCKPKLTRSISKNEKTGEFEYHESVWTVK